MVPSHKDENVMVEDADFYINYECGEILGDGLSSVVRQCIHKETGKNYAVKIIDKFSKRGEDVKGINVLTQVRTEVNALSKLKGHPNIISLKDFYESSAFFFLVFELASGGELFDYLTKEVALPEKVTRRMIWQLLQAIKHFHQLDLVHRDLKPENILLDKDQNILVSDFGFAAHVNKNEKLFDVLGTPAYFAPETLNCVIQDAPSGYGKPVDLWACGVIIYTLLVGQGPFWHRKDTIMYRKILEGNYNFQNPEWDDISEAAKDLIQQLLIVDPRDRMTVDRALKHVWFQGMKECAKCSMRNRKEKKHKIHFKTLVYTIMVVKKLYYTYHERYTPMSYKAVISEPYSFKDVRKIIDSCAFTMYGHWVKRSPDQVQNRAALFSNEPKCEVKNTDLVDGTTPFKVSSLYSYKLSETFLPRRPSFIRKQANEDVAYTL